MQISVLKAAALSAAAAALLLVLYAAYRQYLDRPPGRPVAAHTALTATAHVREAPGKQDHELQVLKNALSRKPGHTPVLMNLAKIEEEKGDLREAARNLQEIVKLEPGNLDARLELGRVLFERGDIQGALDQTQAILKIHSGNPDALYNLGAIYGNLGNATLAREYWGRLIALNPQSESGRRAQQMLPQLENMSH